MEHTDDPAHRHPDKLPHTGDSDALPGLLGIGHSFHPGSTVPRTVLVSNLGDGALYLSGWREGPSAYLTPDDALPLRRELARAFGTDEATGGDKDRPR
jgi:hypothetical protein